jgi:hypothetical protein
MRFTAVFAMVAALTTLAMGAAIDERGKQYNTLEDAGSSLKTDDSNLRI